MVTKAGDAVVPVLEVDHPALREHPSLDVVDPMSRKRRRSGELGLGPAIGMKRELECRPDRRADQLHERLAPDSSRCGHPRPPTRGLHERRRPRGHLGLGAEVGKADGVKDDLLGPEVHVRAADEASSRLAVVDDPAVFDLDPRRKVVREAEPVVVAHPLQRRDVDTAGRRAVVVTDAQLERSLHHPLDRFGRYPRHRRDRRLETHVRLLRRGRDGGLHARRSESEPQAAVVHHSYQRLAR